VIPYFAVRVLYEIKLAILSLDMGFNFHTIEKLSY